jgi:predicted nucleic acid-binding protein
VRAVLVDSNVLIDVTGEPTAWTASSMKALSGAALHSRLMINPIIYAEVSINWPSVEDMDAILPIDILGREEIPYEAAFLAGKCFATYRRRGGLKRSPLPDFFIGAHAAVRGYGLLTRDTARYRTYFPTLEIIAPSDLL